MSEASDGFSRGVARLGAGNVHYREAGEGDPIVFAHGFGVDGQLWTETARQLARSHRCIVPDLPFGSHREALRPGSDLSPPGAAALLGELIAELGLRDVTLVGNDSGGAVCQILVTTDPGPVARLVLTNCDCFDHFPPGTFKLLSALAGLPVAGRLLSESMRIGPVRRSPIAYGALTAGRLPDELLRSWTRPPIDDPAVRRDSLAFFSGMDPSYTLAAAERFGALELPALIAWGMDDRFFKPEYGRRLAAEIPGARFEPIADARTFVSLDQPEAVAGAIGRFLAEA